MSKLVAFWKANPAFRFAVRTLVVAGVGYVVNAYREGQVTSLSALGWGALLAVGTALVGLLTPAEPRIGFFKSHVSG